MKFVFAALALTLALSQTARADQFDTQADFDNQEVALLGTPTYDSPIGECDGIYDEDDLRECRSWRTCIARDAARNRFVFTGSYGKPNKYIVAKAVEKCQNGSSQPDTCHVTVCRFGRR